MFENSVTSTEIINGSEATPTIEIMRCLGKKIRKFLKVKNLTQQKLAATIGVPQSTLASWIVGRSKPKTAAAIALSEALGVSFEYLTSDLSDADEKILQSFSSKLTTLLWKKGLSQAEFARQIGVERYNVNSWITGKTRPRYEDLLSISRFFEVPVDLLLGQEASSEFPEPTAKDVKDSFRRTFGDIVINAGLSQTEVGKILGVTPQQVNKWLTGLNKPTHEILLKISKTFNVSVDFLLGNEPQPTAIVADKVQEKPEKITEEVSETETCLGALPQNLTIDLGNPQLQEAVIRRLAKELRELYSTFNGTWLSLPKAATYCDMTIAYFNKTIRPLVSEDRGPRPVFFRREKLDAAMESRQIGNLPSSRKGSTSAARPARAGEQLQFEGGSRRG
jgi:transcriptional regulator with XRE-family HTH domain